MSSNTLMNNLENIDKSSSELLDHAMIIDKNNSDDVESLKGVAITEASYLGKHALPSSSPLPTPYHKRFRTYDSDASPPKRGICLPILEGTRFQCGINDSKDYDVPVPSSDNSFPMEYSVDVSGSGNAQDSDANDFFEINIDAWRFNPGPKRFLLKPICGMAAVPTIIHENLENGTVYQCAVDARTFILRRDGYGLDAAKGLWSQVDLYAGILRDRCEQKASHSEEDFHILHRHGKHFEITEIPYTSKKGASNHILTMLEKEWGRLIARYGPLNDLQNEQRTLTEKACYMLGRYMEAIASQDIEDMMDMDDLFDPFGDAFKEMSATQYVVRDIFQCRSGVPQFISATQKY